MIAVKDEATDNPEELPVELQQRMARLALMGWLFKPVSFAGIGVDEVDRAGLPSRIMRWTAHLPDTEHHTYSHVWLSALLEEMHGEGA